MSKYFPNDTIATYDIEVITGDTEYEIVLCSISAKNVREARRKLSEKLHKEKTHIRAFRKWWRKGPIGYVQARLHERIYGLGHIR